jgi:hypothetical protein
MDFQKQVIRQASAPSTYRDFGDELTVHSGEPSMILGIDSKENRQLSSVKIRLWIKLLDADWVCKYYA